MPPTAMSTISRSRTPCRLPCRENFLYVFKGARSAPGEQDHRAWHGSRATRAEFRSGTKGARQLAGKIGEP